MSLIVGGVMLLASGYTYVKYARVTTPEPPPCAPPRSADGPTPLMLKPAFTSMIAAQVCIGLHQLFEFGAIWSGAQWVYKLGLILSISCMFFAIRSLEQLTRRTFGSPVVALIIAFVGVRMFLREMTFENAHFWVRGDDHWLWGLAWVALFMYWNVCIWSSRNSAQSDSDGRLLRFYGWAVLNLSFVLSMIYTYLAGLQAQVDLPAWFGACLGLGDTAKGYEIVKDTPSIWCVFAGLQVFLLPFLLRALRKGYLHNMPPEPQKRSVLSRLLLVVAAIALTGALYSGFPVVRWVAEKMLTH